MQAPATPARGAPSCSSYGDEGLLFEEAPTLKSTVDIAELYALQSAPTLRGAAAGAGVSPAAEPFFKAAAAQQLATAPTRPSTITLADLAAMHHRAVGMRSPGGGAAGQESPGAMESTGPSSASTPTHVNEGQRRSSSGSGSAGLWDSGPMALDAAPTATPAAGAVAGPSGSPTQGQAQQSSSACAGSDPRCAPGNEGPLGPGGRWWVNSDHTKLFPSPFASTKLPTGGWPIYLMKYVVPAPWALPLAGGAGAPSVQLGLKLTVPKAERPRKSLGKGFIASILCRKAKTDSS